MQKIGRKEWAVICLAWLITQLATLWFYGIYIKEEAIVYTNIANEVVKGNLDHSVHYLLYAGYILPLVFLKYIGLSFEWMYLLQLALSLTGLIAFVSILKFIKLSNFSIVSGGLLFASCPFFQSWNSHLYSDAFFGNVVVIYTCLLLRFGNGKSIHFILLLFFLIFATFVRPVGFLLAVITLIYLILNRVKWVRIFMVSTWLIFSAIFINFALKQGKDFFYPNHNLELNIICGLSGNLEKYEVTPYTESMSIPAYFFSNPELTWHLFVERLGKSLWMTRPFFSKLHNSTNAILCILYYIPAIYGFFYVIRKKLSIGYVFISGMVIWLIPNVLFCADWHNRFMVPFIPFLLVIATLGIEYFKKTIKLNLSSNKL
jgi:hypothetical protein